MSQVQINRSDVSLYVPASLTVGVMFYNSADNKLYVGDASSQPVLINADADSIQAQLDAIEATNTAEEEARQWRDMELSSSDTAAQTPDWPNRDNILTYRAALRDWPSTFDFPATRPEL